MDKHQASDIYDKRFHAPTLLLEVLSNIPDKPGVSAVARQLVSNPAM
jgi:hypothetical protein